MKDREFSYNAAKEFNELPSSEFHMGEDSPKALAAPAVSDDAGKSGMLCRLFTRRAAARVAAAMLTVVVVADSFGMDILDGGEKVKPVPEQPAQSAEPAFTEPEPAAVSEPAQEVPEEPAADSDAPVLYDLEPEYMNFLAKLYQAGKTEDESSMGILLKEVPEGFPEMTVYFDGEHAQDRMEEGVPTLKYSLSSYSQDGSVPYDTIYSRVGFYFKGKVEEGCRVVLGYYDGTTSYWLEEPSFHSYEGFASLRDVEGLESMDTFHATGFASTTEYDRVVPTNHYRIIVNSSGSFVMNDGRGFLEDGDMTVMWTATAYNEDGSVSTAVAGGSIQDKGKFEVEEDTGGNPRNIKIRGSELYRVIDGESYPDPYYHSVYQEIFYLTDIYEELYAEWSRE